MPRLYIERDGRSPRVYHRPTEGGSLTAWTRAGFGLLFSVFFSGKNWASGEETLKIEARLGRAEGPDIYVGFVIREGRLSRK